MMAHQTFKIRLGDLAGLSFTGALFRLDREFAESSTSSRLQCK